jgi:protease I
MKKLEGKKIVLVVASEGYEQTEYGVPARILRAEGATVITASDRAGGAVAKDLTTTPVDITIDKLNPEDYDGIFFIGGPGAMDCLDNSTSYKIIGEAKRLGIPYGAICIAPRILAKCYGLEGKKATGWDGDGALETIFTGFGVTYDQKPIATDGLVVTASGPEAAEQFAEGITRVVTKKMLGAQD